MDVDGSCSLGSKVVCPAHALMLGFGHDKSFGDIARIGNGIEFVYRGSVSATSYEMSMEGLTQLG